MQTVSIIIPAYKEGSKANELAAKYSGMPEVEVIVALAEEDKETSMPVDVRIKVALGNKGRANQMNTGAALATGDILLFLHADTSIDPDSIDDVRKALTPKDVAGGAYRLKIDGDSLSLKAIAAMANLRSVWLNTPYGDQAIFIKREVFAKIGGYAPFPIMEDVRLVEEMRNQGRMVILNDFAVTSSRKWREEGPAYTTLRNWALMLAYKLGVGPDRLVRWYY